MNEKKSAITPAQAADELYRALLALNEERAVCYLEILKNLRCQIMIGDVLNSFFNSLVGEYIREIPTQGNAIITLANKRAEKLGLSSEKTNDFLLAIAKASDKIAENLPFTLPITCIKGGVRFRDGMEFTVHFDPEEEIKANRYIILGKKNAQKIGLFLNVYYNTLERENITGYHTICGFNHGYFSKITKELPRGCFIPTIEQIERFGLEKDPKKYLKYTEKFCDLTGRYLMTSTVIHQKERDERIYGTSHICLGRHYASYKESKITLGVEQLHSGILETAYELCHGDSASEGIFIFPICFTMDYLKKIEGKFKDKKSRRVKRRKNRNPKRVKKHKNRNSKRKN